MSSLYWILGVSFTISLIAFVGSFTFFIREDVLKKILLVFVALSAGALLGGAFLHLIPEAILKAGVNEDAIINIFLYLLFGFCSFFILEQIIKWHHHHTTTHPKITSFSYLILLSDGIHNFIDGLILAAAFIISFPIGGITALAIALHEIPQEIGDYGVLVYGGFKKTKALILNYISAITIVFGGLTGYLISTWIGDTIIFLLPFAAGSFIYIASTDLIPEILYSESMKKTLGRFIVFIVSIGLMMLIRLL